MSAPSTANAFYDNSTDVHFRSWGSALSAGLANCGFLQTTDPQVNWTTVTAPAAINTYQGSEVWKANDSLQSACPIFFKIEYGSANLGKNVPGTRWTFGTGSDGLGNITGNKTSAIVVGTSGNTQDSTNTYECDFSGCGQYNGSAMGIVMWRVNSSTGLVPSTPYYTWGLFLERSLDKEGNYTSEYYTFFLTWGSNASGASIQQSVFAPVTGNPPTGPATSGTCMSVCQPYTTGTNTAKQNGTYVSMLPIFPLVGVLGNPLTCLQLCMRGDITEPGVGASGTISCGTPYGGSHTYLPAGGSTTNFEFNLNTGDGQGYALCTRWE